MKRRIFTSRVAAFAAGTALLPLTHCTRTNPKRVLVLGGTNFLGPAIVTKLVEAGFDVTLFNRGVTRPELFPSLIKIRGDRSQGPGAYDALAQDNGRWDAVVDVWPENPDYVKHSSDILQGKTSHYLFISSVAVYESYREAGMTEEAAIIDGQGFEEGNYSLNKAVCEKMVRAHFPDAFTILRPGAITGDRDPGPFPTYMIKRLISQARVLAPNSNDPVQVIDAMDIAGFVAHCIGNKIYGIFNTVGDEEPLGYRDMMSTIRSSIESEAEIVWMDPDYLMNDAGLEPFVQLPFWIPVDTDPEPGFYQINGTKALDAGLTITPLAETAKTTQRSLVEGRHIPEPGSEAFFGIPQEHEEEIIEAWIAHQAADF